MISSKKKFKAVGLISGGLDSALAAQVIKNLDIEVHGIYFAMPWGCGDKPKAREIAKKLGIKFMEFQLDEGYLEIVKKPKYGYGTALNPCVDCKIYMLTRAGEYMRSIESDFVFTGEVLGQRPMSQMRRNLAVIERDSNLQGRLLRPLCAQLLKPTIPEGEGIIDRDRLLGISGRSRKEQIKLAKEFGITDYFTPAGGCLLTDQNFACRMEDIFKYGYRNFQETIALRWGRHFRLSPEFKAILGRDERENTLLISNAYQGDLIFELKKDPGPTLILKGYQPEGEILQIAAGLVKRFSKQRYESSTCVTYCSVKDKKNLQEIEANLLDDNKVEAMRM